MTIMCGRCEQPYERLQTRGKVSPMCPNCRRETYNARQLAGIKRRKAQIPGTPRHSKAPQAKKEVPQMRPCLYRDHDHLILSTKANRICLNGLKLIAEMG